jgi:hypothetical protein
MYCSAYQTYRQPLTYSLIPYNLTNAYLVSSAYELEQSHTGWAAPWIFTLYNDGTIHNRSDGALFSTKQKMAFQYFALITSKSIIKLCREETQPPRGKSISSVCYWCVSTSMRQTPYVQCAKYNYETNWSPKIKIPYLSHPLINIQIQHKTKENLEINKNQISISYSTTTTTI